MLLIINTDSKDTIISRERRIDNDVSSYRSTLYVLLVGVHLSPTGVG